jgi:Heterokaryon incompatibility protein (HET)
LEEPESSSTNWDRFIHWCNNAYSRLMSFKCDGKKIVVRQGRNLANVFKRLWNADEPVKRHKYLWTDAICINQADLNERKAQLLMMGNIHRRVETVIAWLGEDFSGTDLAIKALNTLARVPFEKHKEMQNMSTTE